MVFGTDFNAVDIGVLAVILLEVILGLRRGLAGSLFRLLSTLVILVAGLRFYRPFGDLLVRHTGWLDGNREVGWALAFLLILVVLFLVFLLAQLLLRKLMTVTFNEKINRAGGGISGALQGLVLSILLIFAIGLWPTPAVQRLFVEHSLAGKGVFKLCPWAAAALAPGEAPPTPEPENSDKRH
jgi:membrane protein required for colicin V production